jgi:hypothetical protein
MDPSASLSLQSSSRDEGSSSTTTTTSSRKRKRAVVWAEVLELITGLDDPTTVEENIQRSGSTPEMFLSLSTGAREALATYWGIPGWSVNVEEAIKTVIQAKVLPPPTATSASDIGSILAGKIPSPTMLYHVPLYKISDSTKAHLQVLSDRFGHTTESEVLIRVVAYVAEVVQSLDVTVNLDASIQFHPRFTDLFVIWCNNQPVTLVEVKRTKFNTVLREESDETAQVLREVQIVLLSYPKVTALPFVLTNSLTWSFGYAMRKGSRIVVAKHASIMLGGTSADENVQRMLHCLKHVCEGKWIEDN